MGKTPNKRKASEGTGDSPLQKNAKSANESAAKEVNESLHWDGTDLQDKLGKALDLLKEIAKKTNDKNRDGMNSIFEVMSLQQKMNDMLIAKIIKNSAGMEENVNKTSRIVDNVNDIQNSTQCTKEKSILKEWDDEIKVSACLVKVFNVDFEKEIEGVQELRKATITAMEKGAKGSKSEITEMLKKNTKIRTMGYKTSKRDEINTVPILIECTSKEKKREVETVIRAALPNAKTAFHWPKRMVEPLNKIRAAYKAGGMIEKIDMEKAQIMIRPDETGAKLVIHARNPNTTGFTFIEVIGSPITAQERKDHNIKPDYRCTKSIHSTVKFVF